MRFRKLIALLIVAAVLGGCYAFDAAWATSYRIEVVSISPERPVADTKQPVAVVLRLTHFGKPVQGHNLYALPQNGGTMKANIVLTDEDGYAYYTYLPYNETYLMKAQPVTVYVQDENNSILFEVNASLTFTIDLQSKKEAAA